MKLPNSFALSIPAFFLILCASVGIAFGQQNDTRRFTLTNNVVNLTVAIENGILSTEQIQLVPRSLTNNGFSAKVVTDGGYAFDLFWTDWNAPGKVNNADNDVHITQKDFRFVRSETEEVPGGGKELNLYFRGVDLPFQAEASYRLDTAAFYVHRRLSLRDTLTGLHYLRRAWALDAILRARHDVVKDGGFGQPIALLNANGGSCFWGMEYPASENTIIVMKDTMQIRCGEDVGKKVGHDWLSTDWVVEGVAPDQHVKFWFMEYVKRIRIVPVRPYILYNTWYDLRSPRFRGLSPDHVMNEENVLRIVDLFRKNMVDKHGISLDAFVLDDGWDTYRSDWILRDSTFPHGLAPIVADLRKMNTTLGLWFGPIGGYSFSNLRVDWMKEQGYETVGNELCLGGKNYSKLFRKRVVDFAGKDGVGYFKWDGIQFSCSEEDHGHPIGVYSRRAILDTLITICQSVRKANSNVYLNITSGTWLSPWWVKYANQIWMQGQDYGYADVPSISPRDAAMTYRDFVLYDDFVNNRFWFPIANLMTHGIIKGTLQQLGGEHEPLDKFTNESVFYFARGISMWELYVSPDLLSDSEWDAIARSIKWAKDRFPILAQTEMVGGDPTRREPYGYVHFKGSRGIIAARNPWIEPSRLIVDLSPGTGFDPSSKDLVVERVYPDRWISPTLYRSGQKLEVPLGSYESAIYEIFPLHTATEPLVTDVSFERTHNSGTSYSIDCYKAGSDVRLLNPDVIRSAEIDGSSVDVGKAAASLRVEKKPVAVKRIDKNNPLSVSLDLVVGNSTEEANLAILLEPIKTLKEMKMPVVILVVDGVPSTLNFQQSESRSKWYNLPVATGSHNVQVRLSAQADSLVWKGRESVWVLCKQKFPDKKITFTLRVPSEERPMPPRSLGSNEAATSVKFFQQEVTVKPND